MTASEPLFDVIAIDQHTGSERVLASDKTLENADAVVTMAVFRRGVDREYYIARPIWASL